MPRSDPNDFDVYFGNSSGYFFRIYGDGSGINQDPSMSGVGFGIFGRGNGSPESLHKYSHLIQPGTFTSDQWHHFALKRSLVDAQVSLHVNGVRTNTTVRGFNLTGFTGSETAYNGAYIPMHSGQTHSYYTTDDKNGTPTWTSLTYPQDPENDLWVNGKLFWIKQPLNGAYSTTAAIFWDDVNNRWVLTDSPESNLPGSTGFVGPSNLASHVINEVNSTKLMYTDKLAHGFSQGTGAWATQDTGVPDNNTMGSISGTMPGGHGFYSDADKRAGNMVDSDLTLSANAFIQAGGGYSYTDITQPRDITELALWKYVDLTDDDILTIYNEGHSNYSSPSPTILALKGGPTSYYRGGMDDFLMSKSLRNVGTTVANQIVDDTAALQTNANLIKYEP